MRCSIYWLLHQAHSAVKLVKPTTGEMSERGVPQISKNVRLVNPATAEMSDSALLSRSKCVRLINPAKGDISDILLSEISKSVRFVNSAKAETSEILLPQSRSSVKLVDPAKDERFDTELLFILRPSAFTYPRSSSVRLIANSSPVKSSMLVFLASRCLKIFISDAVIGTPDALAKSGLNCSAEVSVGDVYDLCRYGRRKGEANQQEKSEIEN